MKHLSWPRVFLLADAAPFMIFLRFTAGLLVRLDYIEHLLAATISLHLQLSILVGFVRLMCLFSLIAFYRRTMLNARAVLHEASLAELINNLDINTRTVMLRPFVLQLVVVAQVRRLA